MNHTLKMLIPISLGVIAAFINFAIMSASVQPLTFVKVTGEVAVDSPFRSEQLAPIKVPNDFQNLTGKAVPWEERGVLIGQKPSRNLYEGDVVFFQDIAMKGATLDLRDGETALLLSVSSLSVPPGHMRIGDYVSFRLPQKYSVPTKPGEVPVLQESVWVGPFRIVSIDGRLSNVIDYQAAGKRYISDVTIAFPGDSLLKNDPKMKKDLELLQGFGDKQRTSTNVRMAGIRFHKNNEAGRK